MKIRVLIFAAGRGSRLGAEVPKILVEVAGKTILHRHVESLASLGIDPVDVTVVTGYRSEDVAFECQSLGLNVLCNPHWRNSGTFSSFAVFPPGDHFLLVIHGDLVWEPGLGAGTLKETGDIVVPVDPRNRADFEAMKVEVRRGRLLHMSKSLPVSRSAGESMGMFLIRDHRVLHSLSAHLLTSPSACFDDAVNISMGVLRVEAFVTDKYIWEEIDTQEDLAAAERLFS